MPRSVDPSQFSIDESYYKRVQQKNSSATYQQRPQNSTGYEAWLQILENRKLSLIREAEDNLVKALTENWVSRLRKVFGLLKQH
ncbi:hypothetical protein KY285_022352 [Solanum tuberosum]|nr:hypothetical protein KY289_029850 [Solanum tuberosum]KAH0695255.1 hypothetical protein KY285_022352 [Solanum tuberosum]